MDRGLLLLLACALFLPLLGSFGLWDPWETHYGEVGRQITERNDWISTWWGSHWKNGKGGQEGTWFFSKPILLMWYMALGLETFGFSELAIRLGVALNSIFCAIAAYTAGERIWGRRTGWAMGLVLLTTPFFFFLSRQAQTDMPFVANMTIGLCFFMMGMFARDKDCPATRSGVLLWLVLVALTVVPQLIIVGTGLSQWRAQHGPVGAFFAWGPTQAALYGVAAIAVVVTVLRKKELKARTLYFLTFYVFVGLASLAKGLLGFALPGAFIFVYLVLTGQWRRLKEMELLRGIPVFIAVSFPWYVGMLVRHGNAFYQRFFVHDHFKRLATGVHQIDSGSFEHFVKWLGYGLFPWSALIPAALVRALSGGFIGRRDRRGEAVLFLLIWAAFTFTLFTLSSTKFHHYIFPAVPACSMLVALVVADVVKDRSNGRLHFVLHVAAIAILGAIAWDLIVDPQHLKNLFTYKYDRKWEEAWNAQFMWPIAVAAGGAMIGLLLVGAQRLSFRRVGVGTMVAAALGLAVWGLMVYMPTVAHNWSQKGVWDAYYAECTRTEGPPGADDKKRFCREAALSYKLNWRGETYYTQNEVIPIREDHEFDHFIEQNAGRPFFAIMEWSRYNGEFKRKLPAGMKGKSCQVYSENIKFVLAKVPCEQGDK